MHDTRKWSEVEQDEKFTAIIIVQNNIGIWGSPTIFKIVLLPHTLKLFSSHIPALDVGIRVLGQLWCSAPGAGRIDGFAQGPSSANWGLNPNLLMNNPETWTLEPPLSLKTWLLFPHWTSPISQPVTQHYKAAESGGQGLQDFLYTEVPKSPN